MMRRAIVISLVCLGLGASSPAQAPDVKTDTDSLRALVTQQQKDIAELVKRIDALEKAKTQPAPSAPAPVSTSAKQDAGASWTSNVKMGGDLRYRYEMIHQDSDNFFVSGNNPLKPSKELSTRDRQRIRLRLGMNWKINDEINVGAQLATGGADPISANQTLTSAFSRKDFGLDLAYFDYHPKSVEGLDLIGGKMKNPFYIVDQSQNELIWDADLNPEGLAVQYAKKINTWGIFANGGVFQVEERAMDYDADLLAAQLGAKYTFDQDGKLSARVGVSYFDYNNLKNFPPIYDPTNNFSNSLGLALLGGLGLYAEDYNLVEGFTEVQFPLGALPAQFYADYVVNTAGDDHYFDADKGHIGWLVGVALGQAKDAGSWSLDYNYRDLGRDAVIGAFSDSDFGGGGTNIRGHRIHGEYMLAKNVKAAATYFINDTEGSDWLRLLPTWGRREKIDGAYQRLQLDLNLKF